MSSDFCKLSDIANVQGGFAFKSADFSDSGVAVVKIANIQPPSVSLSGADRIPHEKLKGLERFELHDGDVLMAMTGATVGKVGRFRRTEPAYLNQRVARISAVKGKQFDDFVYAVVSLPGFDGLIEGVSAGSAQANISATGIGSVGIRRLSDDEQIRIGAVARTLDDRITLLRETNATLEAIAQALFKSWFVDFDPVRAKQEGRAPEGMSDATAALFPDSFEESELGLVPKGWRIGKVSNLAEIKGGKQLEKTAFSDEGPNPIFGGAGVMGHTELSNATGLVITVGRVGAYCGQFFWHFGDAWVNNNASRIVPTCRNFGLWLYQWLKQADIEKIKKGAAQPFVSNSDISAMKLVIPAEEVILSFESFVNSVYERLQLNSSKAQTLAALRDTLLPRLISGQLRLPETEALIEEATA